MADYSYDPSDPRSQVPRNPPLTLEEYANAAERGRRMAVMAMMAHPEQRRRVEDVFGKAYCFNRYPELYLSRDQL